MSAFVGVMKIVRFNWPWYVAAAAVTIASILVLMFGMIVDPWRIIVAAGILLADFWLVASLAISHYVYDRSPVARGEWLTGVSAGAVHNAAIFHAGLDEASAAVSRVLPTTNTRRFDFFAADRKGTPSLKRARSLRVESSCAIALERIPLVDDALDLALVVFAAHEIRSDMDRATFFRELARSLAPEGRVLVVEHLRDVWNFLAYGPGAFHFLSRRTWIRTFASGELRLLHERPCTPFVRVFELGKT